LLQQRGACFAEDLQRQLHLTRHQTQYALWELATAGLAASDGFDQLRAMIDPERKPATVAVHKKARSSAGRWSLFNAEIHSSASTMEQARSTDAAIESAARMLLQRYGVVFRDVVARESNIPKWSVLLRMLRRLEDRGEVRGGRFISGFGGEQFALPEAVDSLRASRHRESPDVITVAGADPMNLVGIVIPGERVGAVPGRSVAFQNGVVQTNKGTPPSGKPERKPALPRVSPATVRPSFETLRLF